MPGDDDANVDPGLQAMIEQLDDQPPARDLWPGIANRLTPRARARPFLIHWPVALAAGVFIAVASVAATLWIRGASHDAGGGTGGAISSLASTAPPADAGVAAAAVTARFDPTDAALARATQDLEQAVRANLAHLDPQARSSVNASLVALDSAIAQAARRHAAVPADPRAADVLTSTLRKKLDLLRTVSQLTQQLS